MKSSSGAHFIALDHVRALAAFMVVAWHFAHGDRGSPLPFEGAPAFFPLSVLDEGHTGVALFMVLSGYLFSKLLDGKSIAYGAFLWNRALRLLPLLLLVIVVAGFLKTSQGETWAQFTFAIAKGVAFPSLPNGGWSITVEAHYYLVLPLLLWMLRRSPFLPLAVVLAALVVRTGIHAYHGEVQRFAYWTIVGRIDQFVLGMVAYRLRGYMTKRHLVAGAVALTFTAFYWYFDVTGGFRERPSYPSPSRLWIVMPTLEALAYASLVAWYDSSFTPAYKGVSRFVGLIGTYSYSIYLLHFFVVFHASELVDQHVMELSNVYVACPWAFVFFLSMMIPAHLSYRFIESPFLKLRKRYVAGGATVHGAPPAVEVVAPATGASSGTGST